MTALIAIRIVLWSLLSATLGNVFAADLPNFKLCDKYLRELNLAYQRGALGLDKQSLAQSLPDHYSREEQLKGWEENRTVPPKQWFVELHEDVLEYLTAEPGKQDLSVFRTKYGMTDEQAINLLTYFASRHYFNALNTVGDPKVVLRRLSDLSRAHRLTDPHSRLARLYPFYLIQLTRRSVPEIAQLLKVRDADVYRDLQLLGISIEKEFEPYFKRARALLDGGMPLDQVAKQISVGPSALEFILHYTEEINRGTRWDREVGYDKKNWKEEDLLRHLWDTHSTTEIAAILNTAAGTTTDSREYRSAGSVAAKANSMNLTLPGPRDFSDLELEGYGKVKDNGALQGPAIDFLYDNHDIPLPALADRLQVSLRRLKDFIRRNDVVLIGPQAEKSRLPHPLTDDERSVFTSRDTGLVEQWAANNRGGKNRTDEVIIDFVRSQVPDLTVQAEVLKKIENLGMRPMDAENATQGKRQAERRMYTALKIVAEAKGQTLQTLDHTDGQRIFGYPLLDKNRVDKSPVLTPAEFEAFRNPETGLLAQLQQRSFGLTSKPEEVLLALAKDQIQDAEKLAAVISKIRRLGIKKQDHTKTVFNGAEVAGRRLVQALRLIAEAKGHSLTKLDHNEGKAVFGFELIVPTQRPQPLTSEEFALSTDKAKGIVSQFARNTPGVTAHLDERVLDLARAKIPPGPIQDEAVKKIKGLRLKPKGATDKNAAEIVHALRLIATASGDELKGLDEAEGRRIFGWDLYVEPWPVPKLDEPTRTNFLDAEKGMLAQLLRIRGFKANPERSFEALARDQIKEEQQLAQALDKLKRVGLKKQDGSLAREGFAAPAERIYESLRIIAEHKGARLENATRGEGTRIFGFPP